jgi:hypothetical protein
MFELLIGDHHCDVGQGARPTAAAAHQLTKYPGKILTSIDFGPGSDDVEDSPDAACFARMCQIEPDTL